MHAAAFSTPRGPGVACLTHTGNLLVYSLPGLEPLLVRPDPFFSVVLLNGSPHRDAAPCLARASGAGFHTTSHAFGAT